MPKDSHYFRAGQANSTPPGYSYEATMGDYSMASINHAQAQVVAANLALIRAGYEVPTW